MLGFLLLQTVVVGFVVLLALDQKREIKLGSVKRLMVRSIIYSSLVMFLALVMGARGVWSSLGLSTGLFFVHFFCLGFDLKKLVSWFFGSR